MSLISRLPVLHGMEFCVIAWRRRDCNAYSSASSIERRLVWACGCRRAGRPWPVRCRKSDPDPRVELSSTSDELQLAKESRQPIAVVSVRDFLLVRYPGEWGKSRNATRPFVHAENRPTKSSVHGTFVNVPFCPRSFRGCQYRHLIQNLFGSERDVPPPPPPCPPGRAM